MYLYDRCGQGSSSQYSTKRGPPMRSTRSKTEAGRVFTFSSWRTTGTGTTMANPSGGPLYAFAIESTVRTPSRSSTTWVASLKSLASAPPT